VGTSRSTTERTADLDTCGLGPGPIAYRLSIGSRLRTLREGLGLGQAAAAEAIRGTHAKISRLELGRSGIKRRDLADLLDLYGVTDEDERQLMFALADQANRPGWWHGYADLIPPWLEPYIGLEQAARVIRTWQAISLPGLLQTEAYARAVLARSARRPVRGDDAERRVRLRMERQRILTRPDPPKVWAIIDEAVLWRPAGGAATMREQLGHLLDLTELGNVTIQVVPLGTGCDFPPGGPFGILRLAGEDIPDVVYLERLGGALYPERQAEIGRYQNVFNQLGVAAERPSATPGIIRRVLADI
jgi:transcriptional regulator with XRE-family HTH domain